MAADEIDHNYTNQIVCPHCGEEQPDPNEYEDGEWDCIECEKPFYLRIDVSVSYTTTKLKTLEEYQNS
jgi:ribosomal protein L37AE/L43A